MWGSCPFPKSDWWFGVKLTPFLTGPRGKFREHLTPWNMGGRGGVHLVS